MQKIMTISFQGGSPVDYKKIGEHLRARRKELNMTQGQVAEKLNISTAFVGHIERGTRVLSIETLAGFCKVLGINSDHLLGLEYEQEKDRMQRGMCICPVTGNACMMEKCAWFDMQHQLCSIRVIAMK